MKMEDFIKYLFSNANMPKQIEDELDVMYGVLHCIYQCEILVRTSLEDDERSGRPKTPTTNLIFGTIFFHSVYVTVKRNIASMSKNKNNSHNYKFN